MQSTKANRTIYRGISGPETVFGTEKAAERKPDSAFDWTCENVLNTHIDPSLRVADKPRPDGLAISQFSHQVVDCVPIRLEYH